MGKGKTIDKLRFQVNGKAYEIPLKYRMGSNPFIVDYVTIDGIKLNLQGSDIQALRVKIHEELQRAGGLNWKRCLAMTFETDKSANASEDLEFSMKLKILPIWVTSDNDGKELYAHGAWKQKDYRDCNVRALRDSWEFRDGPVVFVDDTPENRKALKEIVMAMAGHGRLIRLALKQTPTGVDVVRELLQLVRPLAPQGI